MGRGRQACPDGRGPRDHLASRVSRVAWTLDPGRRSNLAPREPEEPPLGPSISVKVSPKIRKQRGASGLSWSAQQGQGISDALLEHLVGEPLVREGAGDLERPDHQGEDAECLRAR
jgi:hypothetical protein